VKIVVVEPDPMISDFLVDVLEFSVNREVKAFDNGLKALHYLNQNETFDVVLAEADLPGLSGLDLLRKLKETWPDKVCILMSSSAENEKAAAEIGLNAYLAKPVGVKDLFAVVENFVVSTQQPPPRQG
jgi:DNA-binding response OmpR family regulator